MRLDTNIENIYDICGMNRGTHTSPQFQIRGGLRLPGRCFLNFCRASALLVEQVGPTQPASLDPLRSGLQYRTCWSDCAELRPESIRRFFMTTSSAHHNTCCNPPATSIFMFGAADFALPFSFSLLCCTDLAATMDAKPAFSWRWARVFQGYQNNGWPGLAASRDCSNWLACITEHASHGKFRGLH